MTQAWQVDQDVHIDTQGNAGRVVVDLQAGVHQAADADEAAALAVAESHGLAHRLEETSAPADPAPATAEATTTPPETTIT